MAAMLVFGVKSRLGCECVWDHVALVPRATMLRARITDI